MKDTGEEPLREPGEVVDVSTKVNNAITSRKVAIGNQKFCRRTIK